MHDEHGFTWLSLIPGMDHAPSHVVMGIAVAAVLVLATFVARAQLVRVMRAPNGGIVPDSKLTFRNFFEIVAESLYNLTVSVIGEHDAPRFFPIIGTLFMFIFASNILGLIPGFLPPTDNMNTTLALGAFVFLYYNYMGFKEHGFAYLKHFMGPVIWLAPLMIIIELVGHLARPLSLALRLRGNIQGDHLVLGIFSGLVPYLVPVIFYGLGVFVSFIQAFVFCLLTMVYISMSTSHDH
jgi:F-type H+-transporting ATPase subunit a